MKPFPVVSIPATSLPATSITRREFIRNTAASVAASAAGIQMPAGAANITTEASATELKWSKAACRFCGTGCGVTVAGHLILERKK